MAHARGLVTTTQALRRTFFPLVDIQKSQLEVFRITRAQKRLYQPPRPAVFRPLGQPTQGQFGPRDAPTVFKNENIPARLVQLVNDDGRLEPPITLKDALVSFDRNTHFLLQVSPESYDRPAVCKVMNKQESKEREKKLAKAAKGTATKQIELNWAIEQHDLSHRLKQMETFLEKGKKVEFLLLRKKRKKLPTVEQARDLVRTIKQRIVEVGGTEHKPMDGKLLGQIVMYVEKKKDS